LRVFFGRHWRFSWFQPETERPRTTKAPSSGGAFKGSFAST
jgi:hypothetical protein